MNSSLKTLSTFLLDVPEVIPPRFVGVYFLLDGSEIVYIGQSTDVPSRIAAHKSRRTRRNKDRRWNWTSAPSLCEFALGEST